MKKISKISTVIKTLVLIYLQFVITLVVWDILLCLYPHVFLIFGLRIAFILSMIYLWLPRNKWKSTE